MISSWPLGEVLTWDIRDSCSELGNTLLCHWVPAWEIERWFATEEERKVQHAGNQQNITVWLQARQLWPLSLAAWPTGPHTSYTLTQSGSPFIQEKTDNHSGYVIYPHTYLISPHKTNIKILVVGQLSIFLYLIHNL